MQDRFRFRVYYKPHNKVYNAICLNCDRQKEIIIEYKSSTAIVEWENCEIIQCTGLKDDNGKLIYEGDIVKTLYTRPDGVVINRNCVVEFNRCAFWINYGIGASYLDNDDCIYEIIGNIYENKELLDEK